MLAAQQPDGKDCDVLPGQMPELIQSREDI